MTNKHYMRLEKTLLIWHSSLACQILPFVVARCYLQHSLSSMLEDTANPLKAARAENPLLPGVSGFTQQSPFSGQCGWSEKCLGKTAAQSGLLLPEHFKQSAGSTLK